MARRTLSSTWKNFERLVRQYDKSGRSDTDKLDRLDELSRKVNSSRIVEALSTLFIHPYGFAEATLQFSTREAEELPSWRTRMDDDEEVLYLNAMGVFGFIDECGEAVELLKTPEARKSFHHYRFQAYLAELSKLPSQYILFLLILRQVAHSRHITDVEKKGGEIEVAEGESYLEILWAFKELEVFFKRTNGLDLRSEYRILWLESDWFVGK